MAPYNYVINIIIISASVIISILCTQQPPLPALPQQLCHHCYTTVRDTQLLWLHKKNSEISQRAGSDATPQIAAALLTAKGCTSAAAALISSTVSALLTDVTDTQRPRYICNTHPFNGPFSGTTQVSRYQKGKTNPDFNEARDSEWQWNPLGHMQVCTSLQTDNHASTTPLNFYKLGALLATQPCQSTEGTTLHL